MIRLERRLETPRWLGVVIPLASVLVALLVAGVVLLASGHSPVEVYRSMIEAAFTAPGAFSATLVSATPLVLTGLCAALAFRMRVYNIGGEGQLYMGALGASAVGLALGGLPGPVVILAMILAGMAAGSVWAAIPGLLRTYANTNEILTTLMLNYVAGLLGYYLIFDSNSFWRDTTSPSAKVFPQGKTLADSTSWPAFHLGAVTVPLGFVLGVVLAAVMFVVLRSTKSGFQLRVIAGSDRAGRYAGMRTKRAIVLVMLGSGALAGLAGASQVGDFSHLFDPSGLQQVSYGYTGIVVAALVAFEPLPLVLAAILLGGLINAGFTLQGATFPQGLVGMIEGILLLCVLCGSLFGRFRIRMRPAAAGAARTPGDRGSAGEDRPLVEEQEIPILASGSEP
ncbi:MAG TPA: ABC transporter permease [Actinomycetota bacterium]